MIRKLVFHLSVILFIFCHASTNAQQNVYEDSLLNLLQQSKLDYGKRSELYAKLCFDQLGRSYPKAIDYGRHSLAEAIKSKDLKRVSAAYLSITYAYSYGGHLNEALATADSSLTIAQHENHLKESYWAEFMLSSVYRRKASYDEAVTHAMNALSIAEKLKDKKLLGSSYNSIGILYLNLNNIAKSKEYHSKALAIREEEKDSVAISMSLNNLGIAYRDDKDYDKALSYYFKALAIVKHYDLNEDIAFLYNDIGAAYSKKGMVDSGEYYLKQSIQLREQMGEKGELAYSYIYLGENYEQKHDLTNAETYIKQALSIAKKTGNNKQYYEALESLSDFYSRNKLYDSAYLYLKKYQAFKDTIAATENQSLIAELTTKYETEKKENTILLQRASINKKNYIIGGITAFSIIALIAGIFFYKSYRLRQKDLLQKAIIQQQELATKAVIEAEQKERIRIAGDLHDGVGQVMSAARMNLNAVRSDLHFDNVEQQLAFDKALELVDEGCKEVRSVSHNIMPNALLKTGLVSAIKEFIEKIDQRVLQVSLYSEGLDKRLSSNIETVLYRVIQECVNNVIKHAAANTLDITLINDQDGISVTIEDNGKGFDLTKENNGIGLKNMQTRIDYLKGTIEWDSAAGKGTVVMIQIPATDIDKYA